MECVAKKNEVMTVNYQSYVSDLSNAELFNRVAAVVLTTGVGAGIGAIAGSCSGGLGTGPGAGIGAAVGFGVGVVAVLAWDSSEFFEWKSKLPAKGCEALDNKIYEQLGNKDLVCPITHSLVIDPVKIGTTRQVYEKKALEEWIKKNKTCPVTRLPVSLDDIRTDIGAVAAVGKIAKTMCETNTGIFTKEELQGLSLLAQECDQKVQSYLEKETKSIIERTNDGKIDIRAAANKMNALADATERV